LLLDEPTTGLDAQAVGRLLVVIKEEIGRGATVVVVTHDGGFGDALGGRVIAMERGRVAVGG
jgi:polar amino acid transport system ATP-binding protein